MRKITALFVASTLVLGSANLVHASETVSAEMTKHDTSTKHHKGGHDGKQHGKHGDMFKGLNLTDTQKQQIRTIMQEKHGQKKGAWQQDKRSVHEVVASDSFDKAKAQAQVDKMAETYKVQMLSRLESQNKIYNILTPEQKKQFNEKFEKRLLDRSERQDKMITNK